MIKAVSDGKPGTAMKSFARSLSREEIALVVDFVRENFMRNKAANSIYHSAENGWSSMQAYADAFPFARDEIPLDTPESQLSAQQLRGKFIFMNSCVSCHDRSRGDRSAHQQDDDGAASWEPDAVSYPRNAFTPQQLEQQMSQSFDNSNSVTANSDTSGADSTSGASPYARHDQAPRLSGLSESERAGEALFQNNCAFCHAADGSGKNWIGSFLKPHPRNLSNRAFMATMSRSHLKQVIEEGIPGTTMSSWKNVLNAQQIEQIIDYLARAFGPLSGANTSP